MGYRVEEWTEAQINKNFALPIRADFRFKLIESAPPTFETVVSTTLPIYLNDASDPVADHKDKLSVLVGSVKRLAAQVGPTSFKTMRKIIRYNRDFIYPQFMTFSIDEVPSTEEWISGINHSDARKKELLEALSDLRAEGLWRNTEEHLIVDSFIKDEAYDDLKAPRWINASPDVVKVAWGPYVDKCMHNMVMHPAMIKKIPVSERAKAIWERLGGFGVIAQSSDATAMEDHYANFVTYINGNKKPTDPRYRIINDFMLYMFGGLKVTEEIKRATKFLFFTHCQDSGLNLIKTSRHWEGVNDSKCLKVFLESVIDTYRVLKMRHFGSILVNAILCSGEMNTSLKNTFTMFCMVNYAQFEISGGKVKNCVSFNEGDDALAVYDQGNGPDESWWLKHGWIVKVEFRGPANLASFCGLVFDPEPLTSVPDLRKVLKRFGWTGKRYVRSSYHCRMGLLRAKALSMACEYGNVPILGPLAHRILKLTRGYNVRKSVLVGLDMYERQKLQTAIKTKIWMEEPKIHPLTRDLVFMLQGISVEVQMAVECRLEDEVNLGLIFEIPEIDFGFVGVENMKRCFDTAMVERVYNMKGRAKVCDRLLSEFKNSWIVGHWGSRVCLRMEKQIEKLKNASI